MCFSSTGLPNWAICPDSYREGSLSNVNCQLQALEFDLGPELSVKPFSLLSTKPRNARSAHGGSKGRPAGDERHRQK